MVIDDILKKKIGIFISQNIDFLSKINNKYALDTALETATYLLICLWNIYYNDQFSIWRLVW